MLGLALEGGGARGSYQVGAYIALLELGYKFDYIVGTSIGAINGAVFVQGDVELAKNIWLDIKYSTVADVDDERIYRFVNEDLTLNNFREKFSLIREVISEGGFDTTPFKRLLDKHVDEEKIRNSDIKFGLVTVDLSHFKPIEIFVEDMEKGTLKEYLYASSNLPVFKQEPIRGRYFIDGGFYSNNPVKMLEDKCDTIINIILYPERKVPSINPGTKLITIVPSDELPDIMNFTSSESRKALKLGYCDTYKQFKNMLGYKFFIKNFSEEKSLSFLMKLRDKLQEDEIIDDSIRDYLEVFIPNYIRREKLDNKSNYSDLIVYMAEKFGKAMNLEKYKFYTIEEFSKYIYENNKFKEISEKFEIESKLIEVISGDEN